MRRLVKSGLVFVTSMKSNTELTRVSYMQLRNMDLREKGLDTHGVQSGGVG